MSDEHEEPAEPEFVHDETVGKWLDLPSDTPAQEPPPGDLPDNPPPAPPASVWSRIVRSLRGR